MRRLLRVQFRILVLSVVILGLWACSGGAVKKSDGGLFGREVDYKESHTLPPLEVPPDLVHPDTTNTMQVPEEAGASDGTTYSDVEQERASRGLDQAGDYDGVVLPQSSDIQVKRTGDQRWLVIQTSPEQLWPKVRSFWLDLGFVIDEEDPAIGIMETDWNENRADISDGLIRSFLEKVSTSIYSAATRDKFRTRLERGLEPGTTEVFISHRGVEEVSQGESFVWQPRPSDPELEAELLYRLLVFLGEDQEAARQMLATKADDHSRANMVRNDDGPALRLNETFSEAWRRTGLALDRVGFTVEDRDRSRGIYYVRYVDPVEDTQANGLLSKLKFWGNNEDEQSRQGEYQISLIEDKEATQVVVLDDEGTRDASPTADRILSLLHEQLK
jgi:outer membrane protein assembly factor BamC